MFIVTNDNTDGQLLALRQEIDELRAEIERLNEALVSAKLAAAPEQPSNAEFDRRAYMRDYMRRKRAAEKVSS